jgi:hypothetical protein
MSSVKMDARPAVVLMKSEFDLCGLPSFHRFEETRMMPEKPHPAPVLNLGLPHAQFSQVHDSGNAGPVVPVKSAVFLVLFGGDDAKVRPTVVQAVAVDVINLAGGPSARLESPSDAMSVHLNVSHFSDEVAARRVLVDGSECRPVPAQNLSGLRIV